MFKILLQGSGHAAFSKQPKGVNFKSKMHLERNGQPPS